MYIVTMKQTRKEKCTTQKITRWDRIRKRNANRSLFQAKSDVMKNFVEKDYITQYDESVLRGEHELGRVLNPALVMDLRHEMFRKIPRKLPLVTVGGQRTLDVCVSHNLAVENRYINNELNKLRQQLQKNLKRNTVKMKSIEKTEHDAYSLDNNYLVNSLERTAKHIENFYAAPLDALQTVVELCDSSTKQEVRLSNEEKDIHRLEESLNNKRLEKEKYNHEECISELTNNKSIKGEVEKDVIKNSHAMVLYEHRELISSMSSMRAIITENNTEQINQPFDYSCQNALHTATETNNDNFCQIRVVRFDDSVKVRSFNRENSVCSNTSDGIDSVVSDLAEEALYELHMEAEAKISESVESQLLPENPSEANELQIYLNGVPNPKKGDSIFEPLLITKLTKPKPVDTVEITSEDIDEESTSNHEQNLIIEKLFQSRANTNQAFLRKYFLKWIHFVTIEKIEREDVSSKGDRIHKINLFLDKIRKEKLRLTRQSRQCSPVHARAEAPAKKSTESTQETKKYQSKIKIQQDIIDLQRIKLERQERIIMELKLSKLSDEAKEARQDLKNELKSMIQHGDPKFKAKAKCLQLIGNLREEKEENPTSLHCKAMLVPKFLREMQERALERSIRHEKARQRRLQQEAEKEAQKMAAEEAKRLEDEEAKRLRIEALKEKRRQEKMAKILKEREHQWAIEAKSKADEFYRRLLLRRICMEGFKRLISRKRENKRKCDQFRRKIFKRTYFSSWRDYYLKIRKDKLTLSDELYTKILKRKTLWAWQIYIKEERSKFNVAVDWCDLKRAEVTFKCWAQYTKRMSAIGNAKLNQAKSHHEWHLKWKVLDCWQRLPQILQLERETEERRQRWRMKIWELLPDYTPNRDYN